MNRALLVAVAAFGAVLGHGAVPEVYADRLGGNYRGPGDDRVPREDAPARERRERDPLLASFGLDRPFLSGIEAGRRESRFRGRPLLVFYVLPGCERCASVARGALRAPEVLDLASRFVAVAADAEKEEVFGVTHRIRTIPTILLLDAEGREAGRAEGDVDAVRVAAALREGLKRAGPARPTPEARELEQAAGLLARERKAGHWRALLRAAASIERIGRDGPEREAAREAREEAALEAASRLDAAAALLQDGERTDARRILDRVAREFEGLGEAAEAAALLREPEGTRPAAGGLRGYFRTIGTQNARVPGAAPSLQREGPASVAAPGQVLLPVPTAVPPDVEDPEQRPDPEPDPVPEPGP